MFAETPEDAGMFFQWNRGMAWNTTDVQLPNWDTSICTSTTWAAENDPCPYGWRVPTQAELIALHNAGVSAFTSGNGVYGRYFGTAPNRIFLPVAGWRSFNLNGALNLVDSHGYYWSSTWLGSSEDDANAMALWFNTVYIRDDGPSDTRSGFNIRCVADIARL
jgi:uncharacterized protein (TIGR02145 family)